VSEHDSPGYDGPARLLAGEAEGAREIGVHVVLRGVFQPIDGRYHWYGRVQHDTSLEEAVRPGATVMLRTPFGEAAGKLSDRDPWGRYRVSGTGRPPFPTT
jgi:hypothetical protein